MGCERRDPQTWRRNAYRRSRRPRWRSAGDAVLLLLRQRRRVRVSARAETPTREPHPSPRLWKRPAIPSNASPRFRAMLQTTAEHPELCTRLLGRMIDDGTSGEPMHEIEHTLMAPVRELLTDAQRQGELVLADAADTTLALIGSLAIVAAVRTTRGTFDPAEVAEWWIPSSQRTLPAPKPLTPDQPRGRAPPGFTMHLLTLRPGSGDRQLSLSWWHARLRSATWDSRFTKAVCASDRLLIRRRVGMVAPMGFNPVLRSRIDQIVENAVLREDAPGVVAAVARGDDVHIATAGVMSVGGEPMSRETLFRITSMTKPITAATVLALVDAEILDLDSPVDDLLPEFADRRVLRHPDGQLSDTVPADRPITTRDLLTFTWGFGIRARCSWPRARPIFTAALERELSTFGPPQPATTPDPDTWMARLGELPLLAQPGERWLYQSGAQVLGVLASRAAGASSPTFSTSGSWPRSA